MDSELLFDIRISLQRVEDELLRYETALASGREGPDLVRLLLNRTHSLRSALAPADRPLSDSLVETIESLLMGSADLEPHTRRNVINVSFDAIDAIAASLSLTDENQNVLLQIREQLTQLSVPLPAGSGSPASPNTRSAPFPFPELSEMELDRIKEVETKGLQLFAVSTTIRGDLDRSTFESLPIFHDIREAGSIIAVRPTYDSINKTSREVTLSILGATAQSDDQLRVIVFDPYRWCERWSDWASPELSVPLPQSPGAPAPVLPRRILVAEDEFTSRTILLALLRDYGNCEVAADGREAIQAIEESVESNSPYDLVCLDIMMPHLDGIAVLQVLRSSEKCAKSKAVITTGLSSYKNIHQAFDAGCDSYIVKPISKTVLARQLARIGIHPF